MTEKEEIEQEQEQEDRADGQPVQSAILVQFDAPGSANVQFRPIGSVSASQLLLAAEYLHLIAEREMSSAWMREAQKRAAEQAQLEQVKQMVGKPGRKTRGRKQ